MSIDYNILEKGFRVTHNDYVDYYYAISVDCNEDGDYQFCTKEFKDTAERLVDFLNQILSDKREVEKENEQLKSENNELQGKYDKQSSLFNGLGCEYDGLKAENEQLQQELFESENELLELYYHDNPVRRDQHLEVLKMEFKERFGRDFE